jgi:hypothetical protein
MLGRADWEDNPRLEQIVPQGILDGSTFFCVCCYVLLLLLLLYALSY